MANTAMQPQRIFGRSPSNWGQSAAGEFSRNKIPPLLTGVPEAWPVPIAGASSSERMPLRRLGQEATGCMAPATAFCFAASKMALRAQPPWLNAPIRVESASFCSSESFSSLKDFSAHPRQPAHIALMPLFEPAIDHAG